MYEITTLLGGLVFPEAPRWRGDRLYFSDIYGGKVMSADLSGRCETLATMEMPSGIGWTPEGEMLVVSMEMPPHLVTVGDAAATPAVDLGSVARWPCNDMVIDRRGNAYIGQLGFDILPDGSPAAPPEDAPLIAVGSDGPRVASHDVLSCGNGMAIAADGRTLIVAETFASRITAFTIAGDGSLADRREFARLDDLPDGLCLDAEGAVWAAVLQTGRFVRVSEGGNVTDQIVLPRGRRAIACVLGGADRRTLFLCTTGSLEKQDVLDRVDGRIESVRVDVPGDGIP